MSQLSFSDLKIKLIVSIVAVSGIELLKSLLNIAARNNDQLGWKLGLQKALVISGVMFALMDRLATRNPHRLGATT